MADFSHNKICVALVGYGGWGKNIARTLNDLGALKAVVDTGHAPGTPVPGTEASFAEYTEVLSDKDIDGVVIATPTPTHFSLAKQALEAGKHVCLEKPFVQTMDELSEIKALAKDRVVMVGHLMRYHNGFIKMKALCDAGTIGEIIRIETFRKNFGKFHPHEGALWDIGPHDFSMIYHLLGVAPDTVHTTSQSVLFSDQSDADHIVMTFGNVMTDTQLSRVHPYKQQKVVVTGTKGALVLDDTHPWPEKLMHYPFDLKTGTRSHTEGMRVTVTEASPLTQEMAHFIGAMAGHHPVETSIAEAEAVLHIIHRADRSKASL